jgi:hypothetical protein
MTIQRYFVCDDFWRRFLGSARVGLHSGDVLFFPNTSAVHTLFGRLPIRILFLSRSGEVLRAIERPRRFRIFRCAHADSVQEEL